MTSAVIKRMVILGLVLVAVLFVYFTFFHWSTIEVNRSSDAKFTISVDGKVLAAGVTKQKVRPGSHTLVAQGPTIETETKKVNTSPLSTVRFPDNIQTLSNQEVMASLVKQPLTNLNIARLQMLENDTWMVASLRPNDSKGAYQLVVAKFGTNGWEVVKYFDPSFTTDQRKQVPSSVKEYIDPEFESVEDE